MEKQCHECLYKAKEVEMGPRVFSILKTIMRRKFVEESPHLQSSLIEFPEPISGSSQSKGEAVGYDHKAPSEGLGAPGPTHTPTPKAETHNTRVSL